ncbi:hypothetical protein BGX38DRAFT_1206619 [Terfezia claveryi]|nr:hypothetical protein BGX38DRAFT_1206619 [Terfezia claveryi]
MAYMVGFTGGSASVANTTLRLLELRYIAGEVLARAIWAFGVLWSRGRSDSVLACGIGHQDSDLASGNLRLTLTGYIFYGIIMSICRSVLIVVASYT